MSGTGSGMLPNVLFYVPQQQQQSQQIQTSNNYGCQYGTAALNHNKVRATVTSFQSANNPWLYQQQTWNDNYGWVARGAKVNWPSVNPVCGEQHPAQCYTTEMGYYNAVNTVTSQEKGNCGQYNQSQYVHIQEQEQRLWSSSHHEQQHQHYVQQQWTTHTLPQQQSCPTAESDISLSQSLTTVNTGQVLQPQTVAPEESVHPKSVPVPRGWKRHVSNGNVLYVSPSGSRLASVQEAAAYLQRDGTCKCGLPCPLRLAQVFDFDPLVLSASSVDSGPNGESHPCCRRRPLDGSVGPGPEKAASKTSKVKKSPPAVSAKKTKATALLPLQRKSPCPNVDVRLLPPEQNRPPFSKISPAERPNPSFLENPNEYMAQQTVLVQSNMAPNVKDHVEEISEPLGDLLDCIPDSMDEIILRTLPPDPTPRPKTPPVIQEQQQQPAAAVAAGPGSKPGAKTKKRTKSKSSCKAGAKTRPWVSGSTSVKPVTLFTSSGPNLATAPVQPQIPVLTTRPALTPTGQLVQFVSTITTPEQQLPILTINPISSAAATTTKGAAKSSRKRKAATPAAGSILQAPQPLLSVPQQEPTLLYNVQNFQQFPQVSTLAVMPDGKTYVVLQSAATVQPQQPAAAPGQWLFTPAAPTLITTAPQNVILLQNPTPPPQQVFLHDGTLLQTEPNLVTSYVIRCPATPNLIPTNTTLRSLPVTIPTLTAAGRTPDDGVTSSCADAEGPDLEVPSPKLVPSLRTAQPSPVVQSSHIDSCVHEENELWNEPMKRAVEPNNNTHWLKTNRDGEQQFLLQNPM